MQVGRIIAHVVHAVGYLILFEQAIRWRLQHIHHLLYAQVGNPALLILGLRQDQGHAVVNGRNFGIRGRRKDGKGLNRIVTIVPDVPYPSHHKQAIILGQYPEGRFLLTLGAPFVKTIRDNQAAPFADRHPERRLGANALHTCVDQLGSITAVLCPVRNKAPAVVVEPAGLFIRQHIGMLRWGDVKTQFQVFSGLNIAQLLPELLRRGHK